MPCARAAPRASPSGGWRARWCARAANRHSTSTGAKTRCRGPSGHGRSRGAAGRHGEGSPAPAARARGAGVVYALGGGTAVSLLGFVLARDLFHLMTVPREVAAFGQRYLDTWLVGGPLVFGFFAIEATFRAAGDTRTPFALLAASVLLSIGLDPLLIAGVGPFPRLGVEGAAR